MTKSWETKRDEIESQLEIAERDFKFPTYLFYNHKTNDLHEFTWLLRDCSRYLRKEFILIGLL